MTIFVALMILLIVAWFVYKLMQSAARTAELVRAASVMTLDEAEQQFHRSCSVVAEQMSAPSSSRYTYRDASIELERAVACMDRVQQLKGLPHGPAFRLEARPHILVTIKRLVDLDRQWA